MLSFLLPLGLTVSLAFGGGGKRSEERTLAIKLQSVHSSQCNSCAERMAQALKSLNGVRVARAIPAQDAVLAYFESGKADVDEIKDALKREGFSTKVIWGPAAFRLDGRFEDMPLDAIPKRRPTLKELKEKPQTTPSPPLKTETPAPESEALPIPND